MIATRFRLSFKMKAADGKTLRAHTPGARPTNTPADAASAIMSLLDILQPVKA